MRELKGRLHFFLMWIQRDLRGRYLGSMGGFAWAIVRPLFDIVLYYFVFSLILRVRIPELPGDLGFFFYLLAGLIPWMSVAEGLNRSASALVEHEEFIKKTVVPLAIFPGAVVISSLFQQFVGMGLLMLLLLVTGQLEVSRLYLLPVLLLAQVFVVLGAGLTLAVLSVHLRDVLQALPLVTQLLFYCTPIVYPSSMIPEAMTWIQFLNPAYPLIDLYHSALLGFDIRAQSLWLLAIWVVLLGFGGVLLFRRIKPSVEDYF